MFTTRNYSIGRVHLTEDKSYTLCKVPVQFPAQCESLGDLTEGEVCHICLQRLDHDLKRGDRELARK